MKLISSDDPIEQRFFIEKPIDSPALALYLLVVDKMREEIIELHWDKKTKEWHETGALMWAIISGNNDFSEVNENEAFKLFPNAQEKLNLDNTSEELDRDGDDRDR